MVMKAPNGQDLPDFERLARTFFRAEMTDGCNAPSLATHITPEVAVYEKKLKGAMEAHLAGHGNADSLFNEARRMRSTLLSTPEVKANNILHEYVGNTMIIVEDGGNEASLSATVGMYGKSIEPGYKGEEVEAQAPAVRTEKPLL